MFVCALISWQLNALLLEISQKFFFFLTKAQPGTTLNGLHEFHARAHEINPHNIQQQGPFIPFHFFRGEQLLHYSTQRSLQTHNHKHLHLVEIFRLETGQEERKGLEEI